MQNNEYLTNADRLAGIAEEMMTASTEVSNLTDLNATKGIAQLIEVLALEIVEMQCFLTMKGFEANKKALALSLTTEQEG
ncbi:TPA: hypothetical protein QCV70_002487 [Bacillus cereus]|nr:hypothetical protein [Bacillus cereus]